jgi:hypothetical protein
MIIMQVKNHDKRGNRYSLFVIRYSEIKVLSKAWLVK